MFKKARLKLTVWYLAIIMAISLLFSFAIYLNVHTEFRRFERLQMVIHQEEGRRFIIPLHQTQVPSAILDPAIIQQARMRLITTLGIINLAILAIAGAAGYFLAGRTLRPIKEMVDEQNRFITDASHELRTPLTSLRAETEVGLRNKKITLTEAKKLLKSNLEEAINLQLLSEHLLELTQIGKPQNTKAFTNVSLLESIDAAIKKLNGSRLEKDITIQKKVSDVIIWGIPDRITELFVILLDNAVKYSPEKSMITIVAKRQNGTIQVDVKDQGIGIAKEDLPHIFDRFYRASKSRSKEKVAGYGLGLAIAKEIVTSHKGTVEVKSLFNKGTTLTVHLPTK